MTARGMVPGSSFAFIVAPGGDQWTVGADRMDQRRILRVARLVDVAPVVSPAYEDTATEGTLAPVTGRGRRTTTLDRRLADADALMRAEAALLPTRGAPGPPYEARSAASCP